MPEQQLTQEELSRMRQILAQHENNHAPVKTIDLNNPPREVYHHQQFPKMVYDLDESKPGSLVTLVVRDAEQLAQAVAQGWSEQAPTFGDGFVDDLKAQYRNEVELVDAELDKGKRRRRSEAA